MDLKKMKNDLSSGYYHVWMDSTKKEKIRVFCDMETDGGNIEYVFYLILQQHCIGKTQIACGSTVPKTLHTVVMVCLHKTELPRQ